MQRISYELVKKQLSEATKGAKATIKKEITSGRAHAFITNNKKIALVVRAEGKELVIVALAGSGLAQVVTEIINYAKSRGFESLRFHTKHPERLKKGLAGVNVKLVETRKKLIGKDEQVYKICLISRAKY